MAIWTEEQVSEALKQSDVAVRLRFSASKGFAKVCIYHGEGKYPSEMIAALEDDGWKFGERLETVPPKVSGYYYEHQDVSQSRYESTRALVAAATSAEVVAEGDVAESAPQPTAPQTPVVTPLPEPEPTPDVGRPALKIGKADLESRWGWSVDWLNMTLRHYSASTMYYMRLGGDWLIEKRGDEYELDVKCECGSIYTKQQRDSMVVNRSICCTECGVVLASADKDVILAVANQHNAERAAHRR